MILLVESEDRTLLGKKHKCTVQASSLLEMEEQLSLSLQDFESFSLPHAARCVARRSPPPRLRRPLRPPAQPSVTVIQPSRHRRVL